MCTSSTVWPYYCKERGGGAFFFLCSDLVVWHEILLFSIKIRFVFSSDSTSSLIWHLLDILGVKPLCRRLKKNAVPSQFSWSKLETKPSSRDQRMQQKQNATQEDEALPPICEDVAMEVEIDTSVVIDHTEETVEPAEMKVTCESGTQTRTSPPLCVDNFIGDAEGIHFYTGLENYSKFQFVLTTLGPAAFELVYMYGQVYQLAVRDQFFLTLIKLRRHKQNFELSRLFGISESCVSNIFCTWVRFMSLQWKEINLWPDRDLVRYYSPTDFRQKFPTTRVIVDGTECPVSKPKAPLAQQSTFSTYKNRNTVKVMVGATPGGLVSFVSPAYGGSTSDRQIIERGSMPNKCDPGDSVMADKGFNVQDLFAPYDVSVNIPSFFHKKNRLSGKTVQKDRKIASKRVHIERIIGLGKTYKILVEPMNHSEMLLATDIIFICYALCNFRKCIVPADA